MTTVPLSSGVGRLTCGDSRDPKHERFIRPMGLRYKKAHVSVQSLGTTAMLPILGVKKNPSSPLCKFVPLGMGIRTLLIR